MNFADHHIVIKSKDKALIKHARKSLIFNNDEAWIIKRGGLFDVTMGAFDGAEVCELIGIFILYQTSQYYNKEDFGLYRDDGLAVFKNKNGQQMEKLKKHITLIFKKNDLQITIQSNLKIVKYLDVTLNLSNDTFQPYSKPDNQIRYIHSNSNHPPSIIKAIPRNIEQRLSSMSSNEIFFKKAIPPYEEALKKSVYKLNLTYQPQIISSQNQQKKQRKRNIIWYNPPFSLNVKTKIGNRFLALIDLHFPAGHKLHKIFNRNSIKISYSCMPNLKSIINSHNFKILHNKNQLKTNQCNCVDKAFCPLNNQCLSNSIAYQATVSEGVMKRTRLEDESPKIDATLESDLSFTDTSADSD
ncbi:uncharacterized protein LOC124816972 [Hydra vulgaris]|uniref:uncharacterized protein LOC124816972 n=1 Tax=Hydra vulgaris TaxID=6087 RepID=UPI0032EA457D